jgi:3-keto-5-aminohexanoate cleavage enzyme
VLEQYPPLVINVALSGTVPRRANNPMTPITPEDMAADVDRCYRAGARVFHLHARDADERPVWRKEVFADIIGRVRQTAPDAILCVSTSGRVYTRVEERSDVLDLSGPLKPDLASLTLGSMNFPKEASVNAPDMIARLAARMAERGIVPELEIFEFGMIDYAHYLIKKGVLKPPFVFNLILGSLGTSAATGLNVSLMIERLPAGSFWAAAGVGRYQFFMNALGVVLGGHVRTGLEDNLFKDEAKQEPTDNVWMVETLAALATSVGRGVASSQEARRLMGIAP